ncbi:MAG: CBS domain-containing protein [candidate division Zixibacteria bacterium]|nr:CBS domain-containing protein [candidate division Zixibacteria bacterium]
MKLASLLDPELIEVDLKATLLTGVISSLLDLVAEKQPNFDKKEVLNAVLERETLASTGIGKGFAIPHARTDEVDELVVSIGILQQGLKVKSPDRQPINIFILILTPLSAPSHYLQTLSAVSRFAKMPDSRKKLMNAEDANGVVDIFFDANIEIAKNLLVADILSEDFVTIRPDATLKDAANLFFKYRISGLPVVGEGGYLHGEITDTDLLKFAMPNYQTYLANVAELPETEPLDELLREEDKIAVKKVMTSPMASVDPESSITEVVALMLFKGARRVAVVEDGRLIGIISARDIIDKIVRG